MSFAPSMDEKTIDNTEQTLRQAMIAAMSKSGVPSEQIAASINALAAVNVNLDIPASEGQAFLSGFCPRQGH